MFDLKRLTRVFKTGRKQRWQDQYAEAEETDSLPPLVDNWEGVGPDMGRLDAHTTGILVRAMISAAACDRQIDMDEHDRLAQRLTEAGFSEREQTIMMTEIEAPATVSQLAAEVHDRKTAEMVYAASLLVIDLDTQTEHAHLRKLAHALNLPRETVDHLHEIAGAPTLL